MLGEKEIAVIAGGFNGHAGMQKPMRTSMEGMVVELGSRKGKWFLRGFCSYENDNREYALQKEWKSPSYLWVWSIKNSGRLLFRREEGPKKVFER